MPAGPRGSVHRAPGAITMVQMATSASGCGPPRSSGGGAGAVRSPRAPATVTTRVVAPGLVPEHVLGDRVAPEHREVGLDHLVGARAG